ncbi:PD-(D/E)XK nuclease family protein [Lentilactobacillus senioris]|uniref:PD-(D/E)XK nuclease family protein n=1 Tax=Lentilactobacillus senioris TaxID=931534 RepID=UPI0020921A08|nr:PD-(D/E)XK nuclease family protein [Lentilactobacillus senioris]
MADGVPETSASTQTADLTAKLLSSIDYQNVPAQLNPDIVTGLYGQAIDTSISQLELFYRNPYEYYLRYGLRLQEREVFDLSTQSTGQFFHEALDRVVKITNANQQELTELSDTEIANLVKQVVNEIIHDPSQLQYVILTSSARMQYLTNQLTQTVIQMVQTMRRQGQLTPPMRPKQTELIFGQAGPNTLKGGLDFTLPEKREVHVRGRIDRIDSIKVDNQSYYGVVDYKSGDKTFDYAQAYDGTSMQLLTYLDVLRKNLDLITDDEEALLAGGALYLHVYNPRFTTEKLRKADYDLEKALLEAHTYKGLIVDDAPLVDEMTKEVEPGQKSLVYPLNRLAKGTIAKKNTLINPSDLNAFLLHNEDLIKSAAQRIFAGDNSLRPVKYGPNDTAMQFTPYKAIMNFDPLLPQNNYRMPTKLTVKEVLDSLRGQQ